MGFNSGAATGALLVLLHGSPAYVAVGAAGGGLATALIRPTPGPTRLVRHQILPALLALAALLLLALPLVRRLDVLEMGDEAAGGLGVDAGRTRVMVLLIAVGLSAVAVSVAGPIVFVVLCAPQLARRLSRGTGTGLLPAAAMGALLLSASDLVAETLPTAGSLPVGVVTGALGGVYLAWLLGRGRRR